MGSQVERGSAFGNFSNGGYTGFLINSLDPELNYGISDFDVRHQINVNCDLGPAVRSGKEVRQRRGGLREPDHRRLVDSRSGTTGRAVSRSTCINCRSCWPTNWNLQGNASLVDPDVLAGDGDHSRTRWTIGRARSPNPTEALTFFRCSLPGEAGIRNELRGDGYFNIDISISKAFRLGIADSRLRFRWDVFNVTNTTKFDVGNLTMFPDRTGFGRYNGTLATCDAPGGALHAVCAEVRVLRTGFTRGFTTGVHERGFTRFTGFITRVHTALAG